jgi:hypothetical protein
MVPAVVVAGSAAQADASTQKAGGEAKKRKRGGVKHNKK